MSSSATTLNDCENGDCVQQPSSSTSGAPSNNMTREVIGAPRSATTTQASSEQHRKRNRSCGSSSSARVDGQPSSRRTTPRLIIQDDIVPAEIAISESPHVRGTSDVPLLPTGRGHGSRSISRRNTRSSRTSERSGSSSARADEEPGTELLLNLREHPSVHAREGQNPSTKGLSFRGAWRNAVKLYCAANDQYKQLFKNAGFEDFLMIDPVDLPQGYLIALTERWFAETNTLHLPCGELGPTPYDWTMITGLRFQGQPIELATKYDKEKVRKLLGLGRKDIFSENRIRLSKIVPKEAEVAAVPETREAMESIFRRLFLYVIGSCFFGNSRSVIHYELVQFLEDIDAVGTYDWGAITYAAFLAGMRKKVTKRIGAFTGFWQFLLFWAFEYLNICRPEHAEGDEAIFPRASRWMIAENLGTLDNSELTASRFQLDYVDDDAQVTWGPYLGCETYDDDIKHSIVLAKSRVRFMSLDTWEYYLGERCR